MIKKILLFILALLCCLVVRAQLLWQVTSPELPGASYVFGTHHLVPVTFVESVPGFEDAMNSVDAFYGEALSEDLKSQETMGKMIEAMKAPADSTFDVLLTPEEYAKADDLIKSLTGNMLSLGSFSDLNPCAMSQYLDVVLQMKVMPQADPSVAHIDTGLQQMAEAAGKQVCGLETADFQIGTLYGIPLWMQKYNLMELVDDFEQAADEIKGLYDAYIAFDLDKIDEYTASSTPIEWMFDRVVYKRNADWAEKLDRAMKSGKVMVVVGAAHLPGERGLLQLLRNKGYNVTPVK